MVRVKPDRILGALAQMFWILTIVHNTVVHGQTTGIVYRPSDNRQIAAHQRNFWLCADLYPLGSWSGWTFLSQQAAAQDQDRQCEKSIVHVHTSTNSRNYGQQSTVFTSGSSARTSGFARRTSIEADVTGPHSCIALRNRRVRDRRHVTDLRCAGRKRRSRDEFAIPLPR